MRGAHCRCIHFRGTSASWDTRSSTRSCSRAVAGSSWSTSRPTYGRSRPLPQLQGNRFHKLQVALAGQALVGYRERSVKALGLLAQQSPLENAFEIANAQLGTGGAIQKNFHVPRIECRIHQRMKLSVSLLVLDRYHCLFKHRSLPRRGLSEALPPVLNTAIPRPKPIAGDPKTGAGDGDRTRDQQLGRL